MSFKSGFISVIGRPNTGKSTLVNAITGEKISIISRKPQTTRNQIRAILNEENSQIIFVDTPGVQTPRNKLGEFMAWKVEEALQDVDGIIFIIEATDTEPGPGDIMIAEKLKDTTIPVLLVINKIDKIKKASLLPIFAKYIEILKPASIIPISALTGEGVADLMDEVRKIIPEGPIYFDDDITTDSTERELAAEMIREKILDLLNEEVPHGIAIEIFSFQKRENKNLIDIEAEIICEKKTHKGIVIGKDGLMLQKIGSSARADIEKMTGVKVNLQLYVRVREDWRNDERVLKDLGYKK